MFTIRYRPKSFKEISGQVIVKKTLQAIVRKPEEAPKVIILAGSYGVGKTSIARAFARALICRDNGSGDSCGICEVCKNSLDSSVLYEEYDSALIGNTDSIKVMREFFTNETDLGYKVIVLDEAQLISPVAQAALLKVFEETSSKIFFILCTTDVEKLIPTIRSRSLELSLELLSEKDIKNNLKRIIEDRQIEIDEATLNLIILRSSGHLRDAQMILDRYCLLEREDFLESTKSAREFYIKLLICCIKKDKEKVERYIYLLEQYNLNDLKRDYESFILEFLKVSLGTEKPRDENIGCLCNLVGYKTIDYYKILVQDMIFDSFESDKRFQASMWYVYTQIAI